MVVVGGAFMPRADRSFAHDRSCLAFAAVVTVPEHPDIAYVAGPTRNHEV